MTSLRRPLSHPSLFLAAAGFAVASLTGVSGARAQAQLQTPQPSPRAKIEQRVGVTDFSVEYSSPAVKGRKIWGGLVPYDQVWRSGANAATKLTVSRDFTFGDKPVKAGSYGLYTIPGKQTWTVVLNSRSEDWGTSHDPKNDVARITVRPGAMQMVRERLTYLFTNTTDDSTALDLEWEKVRIRVPFKVDTKAHVQASIEQTLGEAWRPHFVAARYLFESGGDLDQALSYADTSIAIRPMWSNHWTKAQILGKKGNKAEAIAAAEKAQSLGQGDRIFEGFFKADVAKAIQGWR
jgi:hypothetical protein